MSLKEKILVFRNFLSVEDHTSVVNQTLEAENWCFGRKSNLNSNEIVFWGIDLKGNKFFSEKLLQKINDVSCKNFVLVRVDANGQSYGQCGTFHRDDERENLYTLVYFVNPIWDINWGGNIVCFDVNTKEIYNEPFEPNKAVLFPSNTLHYGSEPTRMCFGLRVTVAWVLKDLDAT